MESLLAAGIPLRF